MRPIRFRAWDIDRKDFIYFNLNDPDALLFGRHGVLENTVVEDWQQYTGHFDPNGQEWAIGDIGEFDNGDRFVLKMESLLEVWGGWIGDPECEDQARDLYRIERATIIGNIYENPELLDK
jgi:hypothetical protein